MYKMMIPIFVTKIDNTDTTTDFVGNETLNDYKHSLPQRYLMDQT